MAASHGFTVPSLVVTQRAPPTRSGPDATPYANQAPLPEANEPSAICSAARAVRTWQVRPTTSATRDAVRGRVGRCLLQSGRVIGLSTSRAFGHFVLREELQRLHQAGMVPPRAAARDTRAEELLRARRVGEREPERARARQREVEILLVQLDPEAGLKRPLDHPFAVHFEDARRRESTHQSLPHPRRIR